MRSKRQNKWQGSFILFIALGSAAIAFFAFYTLTHSSYSGKNCQEVYDTWHEYFPNTYFNIDHGLPYQAYADSAKMLPSTRRALQSAFIFYQEKNFHFTFVSFQDVMPKEELKQQYPDAFFFYALTALELRDFAEASKDLSYLCSLESSFGFADEAQWYFALSLIGECKTKEAKEILGELEKKGSSESYRNKAAQLMQAL